jgi:hypothetical protein
MVKDKREPQPEQIVLLDTRHPVLEVPFCENVLAEPIINNRCSFRQRHDNASYADYFVGISTKE